MTFIDYKKNFLDQLNETVSAQPNGKRSTNKNDIVLSKQFSVK